MLARFAQTKTFDTSGLGGTNNQQFNTSYLTTVPIPSSPTVGVYPIGIHNIKAGFYAFNQTSQIQTTNHPGTSRDGFDLDRAYKKH